MGNGSRLILSRGRTTECRMARWGVERKIAVANEPVERIRLRFEMPNWKSWLMIAAIIQLGVASKSRRPWRTEFEEALRSSSIAIDVADADAVWRTAGASGG